MPAGGGIGGPPSDLCQREAAAGFAFVGKGGSYFRGLPVPMGTIVKPVPGGSSGTLKPYDSSSSRVNTTGFLLLLGVGFAV